MNRKILLVDDDRNILSAYTRNLRKKFELFTAQSGSEGLELLQEHGPFAAIVSDYLMPEMDGIEFLTLTRNIYPDTVRIMLSGQADMNSAINAINEGNIFRFLTKPCSPENLLNNLNIAVEQYRLINSERELLDKTLKGSVKVLIDILSMVSPLAFSQLGRIRSLSIKLAERSGMEKTWEIEIAALLSQIGCVTVPGEILKKKHLGKELSKNEEIIYFAHPRVARKLLLNIPRLENISEAIAYQLKPFNAKSFPADTITGRNIPLISRILKVAHDFDELLVQGKKEEHALKILQENAASYDPHLLSLLEAELMNLDKGFVARTIPIEELIPGMVLADDIKDNNNVLLIQRSHEITDVLKMRLLNYSSLGVVSNQIKILEPIKNQN